MSIERKTKCQLSGVVSGTYSFCSSFFPIILMHVDCSLSPPFPINSQPFVTHVSILVSFVKVSYSGDLGGKKKNQAELKIRLGFLQI